MNDVIRLLPDAVANQIAAGEVVQRPASVVKELMENALDAEASHIQVILKNAGKSLIQVIDNGKGMSPRDARMAFERHATSKIATAQDLFNIRTMGFRGEALASIASVAEVELRTKRGEDELGTSLSIAGSQVENQESIPCDTGTNLMVRNLFFTVPARRKFLKSDNSELRNITQEFLRVALTAPQISFSLIHNGTEIYQLPVGGLRQRIIHIFGKALQSRLISIHCDTGIIRIEGYICTPEQAKKSYGEQYFFVNGRYMKHHYFHKAVAEAYSGLLSPEMIPSYFLFFTIDPGSIDVNIHPTKTEIKFQDEPAIFQILLASLKEALGKFNIIPTIDFDTEYKLDFPVAEKHSEPGYVPDVAFNPDYNPFQYAGSLSPGESHFERPSAPRPYTPQPGRDRVPSGWEKLFEDVTGSATGEQLTLPGMEAGEGGAPAWEQPENPGSFILLKGKYILASVRSGVMFIHRRRACERILFEYYLGSLQHLGIRGQKSLFPELLELSAADCLLVHEIMPELTLLGFELEEAGEHTYRILASPEEFPAGKEMLLQLIDHYKNTEGSLQEKIKERMALSMAKSAATSRLNTLLPAEMQELFEALLACSHPGYTPEGKPVFHILKTEEITPWFG